MSLLLFALAWAASQSVVHLVDGQTLTGVVTFNADGSLSVQLADGSTVQVPPGTVARVVPLDQPEPVPGGPPGEPRPPRADFVDPHGNTYFWAPSGWSPEAGHGSLAQKELAGTLLTYGVTDTVSVQAGTVVPLAFTSIHPWTIGVRYSGNPDGKLRAGVGFQAFSVAEAGFGAVTAHLTTGSRDTNFTLHAGAAGALAYEELSLAPMLIAAGQVRTGRHSAFVTENHLYVFPGAWEPVYAFPSAGMRWFGPSWAFDTGLMAVIADGGFVPLPVLSFQWSFDTSP